MSDMKFRVLFEGIDRITAPFRQARTETNALKDSLKAGADGLKRLADHGKSLDQLEKLTGIKRAAQENAAALREDLALMQAGQSTVAESRRRLEERRQTLLAERDATKRGSEEYKQAQAALNALTAELRQANRDYKEYETAISRASRESQQAEAKIASAATKMGQLRDRLKEAGLSTASLADAQAELKARTAAVTATFDKNSAAMAKMEERTKRLAAARENLDRRLNRATGLAASGMSGVATGRQGLTALDEFTGDAKEAEHTRAAFALTAGIDATKLEEVRQRVKALAAETNQDATDLQDALGVLVGKGMEPDAALEALRAMGFAATGAGADIRDMAALTFSFMDNLKIAPAEIGKAIDIATKSGDLGGFELKDMAKTFPMLTASAQAMGLTGSRAIGTLTAALQVAMKGASSTDEAANNMANFLAKITAPETVKRFDEFGIDIKKAMTEAVGKGENPFDVMLKNIGKAVGADLEKEMDEAVKSGLNPEQAAQALGERFNLGNLFGDMQVLNALGPLLANMGEFRRIRDEAMGAEGTVNAKFAAMMQTSQEIEKSSSIAWKNLKETLGTGLLPILNQGMAALRDLMVRVTEWAGKNPETARTILLVAGGLAAVIAVGGALAVALAGLVAPIAAVQFAMGVLNVIMAANPLGLIVLAVAAVIAALALMVIYWDDVKVVVLAVWEYIKTALSFSPLGLIAAAWGPVVDYFKGDIGSIGELVEAVFGKLWERIKSFWGALKDLKSAVTGLFSSDAAPTELNLPDPPPLAAVPSGQSLAAVAGGSTTTTTNTITVNAAPGMDEKQVGEEVARQLREKEARDRAKTRTDYSDRDL
ncbi:phage tail tape measure protein [Novispirillum itersonii]|uniref:phage tail tape measure protein n=1 Tax=Novispirillum itersonii TaxID=189 RepID=UPI0003811C15|nr:phage tail tape measure protein [Novispirillum itersonii]